MMRSGGALEATVNLIFKCEGNPWVLMRTVTGHDVNFNAQTIFPAQWENAEPE